jgi:YVTN family beta-propeller protein
MAPRGDRPIGSELLGYRIEAVLGRGGTGVVYLADDLRLKRKVALKLLSPELAGDPRLRERLLVESEHAAGIDHPNIVPIYAAGQVDETIFISMRYVPGRDLKALLRDGPITPQRALALLSQVASALDAAHAHGLVHRDVKPSNILLDPESSQGDLVHVYLADFGVTKRLSDPSERGQQPALVGTIEYVAPEQIRGEDVDGRADVYALGCVLYECLAGEPPFGRGAAATVLFSHLQAEPPTLPGLDEVLPRALAKRPDERYGTCRELMEAARAGLGLGVARRSPRRVLAVGIAALAAAGAALAFVLARSGGHASADVTGRLVRIDPATNAVSKSVAVGRDPSSVTVGAGEVWLSSLPDDVLWRIDPSTLATTRISVAVSPFGVAIKSGPSFGQATASPDTNSLVFVAGQGGVATIDPGSGRQTGTIDTGDATAIGSGPAGVWVVAGTADRLLDASFGVGKVVTRITVPRAVPADEAHARSDEAGIAVGADAVWVLGDIVDRHLYRLDPSTPRVTAKVVLPGAPAGVATGLGAVWVTDELNDRVLRVDPLRSTVVATIPVGRAPYGIATGAGAVWVANGVDETVSRIDPLANRVVATIGVRSRPRAVAVGAGSVWVAGRG